MSRTPTAAEHGPIVSALSAGAGWGFIGGKRCPDGGFPVSQAVTAPEHPSLAPHCPGDGQQQGEGTLYGKTVSWEDTLKISREAAFS